MVGRDHLDGAAQNLAAEILHRQLGREHRARSAIAGIDARHVVDHADPERRLLGEQRRRAGNQQRC
jgi:hypothetical protein